MSTTEQHRVPGLKAIARHAAPNVLVATIIPTSLFYVGWYAQGREAAFALALAWGLTVLAWRSVRRQRVPALLVLTTALLVVRTAVALTSGSTRVYFMQPIVTTVIIGMMFLVSVAAGRPLISRLAVDFFPLPPEISAHDDVQQHFRKLSYLWAFIYFCNATVTLLLLMNLPVTTFLATKTLASLAITWGGIALTATSSMRVLHRVTAAVPAPATADAAVPAVAPAVPVGAVA